MKNIPLSSLSIAICVAATGMAASALAQPDPDRAARREVGSPDAPRSERRVEQPRRPALALAQGLSPEQRERLRDIMAATRERVQDLEQKAQEIRREMNQAVWADRMEEDFLRRQAARLAEVETERILVQAQAVDKFRRGLTPEQRERIGELRSLWGAGWGAAPQGRPLMGGIGRPLAGPPPWAGQRFGRRDLVAEEDGRRPGPRRAEREREGDRPEFRVGEGDRRDRERPEARREGDRPNRERPEALRDNPERERPRELRDGTPDRRRELREREGDRPNRESPEALRDNPQRERPRELREGAPIQRPQRPAESKPDAEKKPDRREGDALR